MRMAVLPGPQQPQQLPHFRVFITKLPQRGGHRERITITSTKRVRLGNRAARTSKWLGMFLLSLLVAQVIVPLGPLFPHPPTGTLSCVSTSPQHSPVVRHT